MALIIPEGYAQVVLNYTAPNCVNGVAVNTFGFGAALGEDPTSLEDFTLDIATSFQANLAPLMDTQVTLSRIDAIGASQAYLRNVNIQGEVAYVDPPPNVAILLQKETGLRGRRARGRCFLYGFCNETQIDSAGLLDPLYVPVLEQAFEDFIDAVATEDPLINHVILQGEQGIRKDGSPGTPPISPPPVVTSVSIDTKVTTQRDRLR